MFIVIGGFMKNLGIYLLIMMCFIMTGCGEPKTKEVITMDEFTTIATNNNFTVSDNNGEYEKVSYISDSKIAVLDDIEVEMITYTTNDYAEQVIEGHIENFNLLKNTGAHEKNTDGENYHRYFLVSNNKYMISSRVENTLIFCKTDLDNKETVDKLFEELGY